MLGAQWPMGHRLPLLQKGDWGGFEMVGNTHHLKSPPNPLFWKEGELSNFYAYFWK